ncbi:hypothetical protein D3C79_1078100 [compost metagenome]
MGVEFDLGENLRVEADLLAVEQGHLAANHSLLFQALNPSPAGRLGKTDALGNLRAGQRSILL